jgi:hypothetical protein
MNYVSTAAAAPARPHIRRQAAPPHAFTRIRAQLAAFTNETKAACRPRNARDRELLHVLQHVRKPHKLGDLSPPTQSVLPTPGQILALQRTSYSRHPPCLYVLIAQIL